MGVHKDAVDTVNSRLVELVQTNERRFQLVTATTRLFHKVNESLQEYYARLERILVLSLSNWMDIAEGQNNNVDNARKILKPSFEYLERVNNVVMIRLAGQLESEIPNGTIASST